MQDNIDPIHADVAQIRSRQDEICRHIANCELRIAVAGTRILGIEQKLRTMVILAEFLPVKWMAYGIAGTTLAAVLTALVAGVLVNTPRLLR